MDNLVPLLVHIGLRPNRGHLYPDLNRISPGRRCNEDWCHFVDRFGGWIYDRTSGHQNESSHSPRGEWLGLLMVPESFAEEAVDLFTDECSILDDTEAAQFYESHVTVDEPEIEHDLEALQLIAAKRSADIPEDEDDRLALDVDSKRPGRRRNLRKQWAGYKAETGCEVDSEACQRLKGRRTEALARRAERRRNRG